jgi:hypothetical protein
VSVELFDDPDLDHVLASGLSALAPEVEAVDVTLAELRPRFHRARTRRRVVRASAAIAALLVVGSVAIAEAPSARRSHVTVESPVRRTETTHARKRISTPPRPRASTTTPPTAPAPTNTAHAFSSPPTAPAPAVVVSPTAPPTLPAPAPTPPSAPKASQVRRFFSTGGSIEVRLSNGRLTLTDVSPARGYRKDVVTQAPQWIEVRFTRNGREPSDIEVGILRGKMVEISHIDRTWSWRHLNGVSAPSRSGSSVDPSTWNWG